MVDQGRDDTMPKEVQQLDDEFFLLNIRKGKRVTLPDAMMEHLDLQDGDLIVLKLVKGGLAHMKKFESEVIKF